MFHAAGEPTPSLELRIDNAIPLSRGLGSSAAAITAGLMLANALAGEHFDRQRLLEIGLPLEGHPDNLAPAMFGGLRVSSLAAGRVLTQAVALPRPPRVVLFVPDFAMSTAEARRVLPDSVPRADAIFNTGRSSMLVAALAAGDMSALRWAMEDRLHQPYRAAIFPALPNLIAAALDAGASGAALSGAGSTVLPSAPRTTPIARALERAAATANLPATPEPPKLIWRVPFCHSEETQRLTATGRLLRCAQDDMLSLRSVILSAEATGFRCGPFPWSDEEDSSLRSE